MGLCVTVLQIWELMKELIDMYLNLIIILLIIISALAKAGADYLLFNTTYLQDKYKGQAKGFLESHLPFLFDKWHRSDAIRTLALLVCIALLLDYTWYDTIFLIIIYFGFYGIIFEIRYNLNKKFSKIKK
ncbi:MAG: hypothetical protein QXG00_04200 [Candidatus Woesearchaeota archaeon]